MILLGDIAGEDAAAVAAATSEVVRLANGRSGEGFIAVSPAARQQFWLDRAKTAAIAKHTNAFKINEDVVIPLERLGEYTDAIERINIELSIRNKLELVDALTAPSVGDGRCDSAAELDGARARAAQRRARAAARRARALELLARCPRRADASARGRSSRRSASLPGGPAGTCSSGCRTAASA